MAAEQPGGEIVAVTGVARAAGLLPGDRLLSANGRPLRDIIDFRFYADGPRATFEVLRGGEKRTVTLRRPPGSDWGIAFTHPIFDRIRPCANRCPFCFLDQLPAGLRPGLYLRDDDYRLSFLYGNFVTLTNLRPEDWERLAEQRLSPLYVSVHATEPELRRLLLGRPDLPDIREQLARLARLGIAIHAQVVLCPGGNDGVHLERTVADLAGLFPTVRSISLVPVGLTRFRRPAPSGLEGHFPLRPYTSAEARDLLRWAEPRRRAFRRMWGCSFLYPADEFYLLAGRPVPSARLYDGFPQVENGVGLVRLLLDDWVRLRRQISQERFHPRRLTLACGTLIAPLLSRLAGELASCQELSIEVLPVENITFGPTVTVSGLLTGEALRAGLRKAQGEILFLPRTAFDERGRTLDEVSVEELERELGRPIFLAERMHQVVRALRRLEAG
ncbi:MAG: DUF512 domain-containing protein [Chloroflexia bacterium]